MLAKFSGLNPKGPYQSFEKEKETLCVLFTHSVKLACENSRFSSLFAASLACVAWRLWLLSNKGGRGQSRLATASEEERGETAVFAGYVKWASEIRKFHVAVVQRWLRNVQKSVMHVQSCCFTNINLLPFLPFSLPSASLLPKLPFEVIQTFCHHCNVASHFSSLLLPLKTA